MKPPNLLLFSILLTLASGLPAQVGPPHPVPSTAHILRNPPIIPKPLRNEALLSLPKIPAGYKWTIESSSPANIVSPNGTLTRPDVPTKVTVHLKLTNQANPTDSTSITLSVPIDPPYVAPVVEPDSVRAARDRYERKKYGLFVHYVPGLTTDGNGGRPDIDTLAREFDAARFARDASDFGVEYVIFTVMHFKARMLYPSETNKRWRDDRRAAPAPGKNTDPKSYSDDDLIARLASELAKKNIDLHLYVHPVDGHDFSKEDQNLTGWNDCDANPGDHQRWNDFQNELFDELVLRYAGRIKGLWFDGMFKHTRKPRNHPLIEQTRFRETLLAYDPSLVLLANVSKDRRPAPSPEWVAADYRAYEISRATDRVLGFVGINPAATEADSSTWPATCNQIAMIIGGNWWAQNKKSMVRQSPENLFRYIVHQASLSHQGGFAMSAGCFPGKAGVNGNIWEGDFHETMLEINRLMSPVAIAIKDTRPGKAFPTREGEWLSQKEWGVSTESPDGKTIYLHIMKPPAANTLNIGPTADESTLGGPATMLRTGEHVALRKTATGYEIVLPPDRAWDPLNTVIKVRRLWPPGISP